MGFAAAWLVVLAAIPLFVTQPARAETGPSLSVPGLDQERLNPLIGEWTTEIKSWKTPESEPVTLKGTVTRRWTLNGRFVEENAENETSRGKRFRSIAYLGYNRGTELYERFWMTNTWTGMFTERGRYDPDSNVIRLQGSESGASGIVTLTTSELKIDSPDRHVLTTYTTGADGVRWKQLEIVYSKK